MNTAAAADAQAIETSCALTAVALSRGRRGGARVISGERRAFGLNPARTIVHVPYPHVVSSWTRRTLTCGIALQCAPSKDRLEGYALHEMPARELACLALVEGGVALGWVAEHMPGLVTEIRAQVPALEPRDPNTEAVDMIADAIAMARGGSRVAEHPLLGAVTLSRPPRHALTSMARRMYGRMPWTSSRVDAHRAMSIPVGGEGGVRNPNLPPPSRPENEDIEIRPDQRVGIPYPEWNLWTEKYLRDHVAVLERRHPTRACPPGPVATDIRCWFEQRTHRAMRSGLEEGSDIDIDRYTRYFVDAATGETAEPRIFRDLVLDSRDVTTAILLDGSSSLGVHQGQVFRLELACADALSRAMTLARERHGIFLFTGNTRHRVEVRCLKDFQDRRFVDPGSIGLATGGYTRLGGPLRHLTSRLLAQPSERRLLIIVGDGLMSDEGYEGRYAWADVARAVLEAEEAGVSVYYLGVGPTRVDPLPTVFGDRRSRRIRRVEELPRVLAHVHRELVA
ncbi:nitric oxide reductase activation protein NorD [Nocardia sp. NPDC057455]|uniref:nitric oxide reductase activation protein NorD n=1 Tax=Nocardia sp. NPDC057455 TaxID=3346138 RepID=UPI00366C6B4C